MTEVTLKKKGEKIACLANFRLVFKEKYCMESHLVKCLTLAGEHSPKKSDKDLKYPYNVGQGTNLKNDPSTN